jgi:acetolactate synthase I/II/III large subunit
MRTAAAELVAILHDEGVSHLFVNPGMHTAPLRQALAEADAASMPHPQPVLCVHEHVAVSAAHGHHLAGGGPQAVMLHVETGRLNVGGSVQNAQRDQVPVAIFCGGGAECRSLLSDLPDHPPADQPLLGAASKWAVDLSRGGDLSTFIRRAFQIARAAPGGPTHVALPVDLLRQAVPQSSRRLPPPRTPAPDMGTLEEMAELLASAEAPVIVAGRVGRHLASVHQLARLAETLAAPVIDLRNHVNMPPGHPLNAALEGRDLLARADAILLLDADAPCMPGLGPMPAPAWLLQIDTDCLKADLPGWVCPIEIAVTADTRLALQPLVTLLNDRMANRHRQVQDRRHRVERELKGARASWRDRANSTQPGDLADAVLAELDRWLPEDSVMVEEASAGFGSTLRQLDRPPGHVYRCLVDNPGWALGAALGARLARPSQPVVAICDERAFSSALPAAAFWSAHRGTSPFLTVVLDQSGHRQGRPSAAEQPQDVVTAARAAGAETAVVTAASEVAEAVERLLATTRDGVCTVLDVRLPVPLVEDYYSRPGRRRNPLTSRSTATKRQ